MSRFSELNRNGFEQFLQRFTLSGTLKFRNNKWVGLNREGKPFTIHVKHGSSKKYSSRLVETVAKDLKITPEEFRQWHEGL